MLSWGGGITKQTTILDVVVDRTSRAGLSLTVTESSRVVRAGGFVSYRMMVNGQTDASRKCTWWIKIIPGKYFYTDDDGNIFQTLNFLLCNNFFIGEKGEKSSQATLTPQTWGCELKSTIFAYASLGCCVKIHFERKFIFIATVHPTIASCLSASLSLSPSLSLVKDWSFSRVNGWILEWSNVNLLLVLNDDDDKDIDLHCRECARRGDSWCVGRFRVLGKNAMVSYWVSWLNQMTK